MSQIDTNLQILIISFLSGSTTLIGILLAKIVKERRSYISLGIGFTSGIMIVISFLELFVTALEMGNELWIILTFFLAFLFIMMVDIRLPHIHLMKEDGGFHESRGRGRSRRRRKSRLIHTSYLIAIGLTIHDFPEGFAMASSFKVNPALGLLIAVGIAIHNIPEEFAMAVPLVLSDERGLLLKLGLLSFLAEPLGAIFGIVLTSFLSQINPFFLAFAAGVMVYVAVDELVPLAYEYKKMNHFAIGFICGITLLMILSIFI